MIICEVGDILLLIFYEVVGEDGGAVGPIVFGPLIVRVEGLTNKLPVFILLEDLVCNLVLNH